MKISLSQKKRVLLVDSLCYNRLCNDEQITRKLVQKDELLMFDLMDNLLGVQSFGELNKDMPTTLFCHGCRW